MMNQAPMGLTSLPAILTEEEDLVPVREHFVVDSLDKALWAASKVAAERTIEDLTALGKAFHERIDAWLERACTPHLDTTGYLGSLLRPFVVDRLTGVKARSLTLPGYRIGLRTSPARVLVEDQEVALAWLEKAVPEAVAVTKEVVKSAVKPLLASGKEVPGVVLTTGEDVLYVQEEKA
jgi:hypothetical protein